MNEHTGRGSDRVQGNTIQTYLEVVHGFLGADFVVPRKDGAFVYKPYQTLHHMQLIYLMECAEGIARCFAHMDRLEEALNWAEEVDVICINAKYANVSDPNLMFDWMNFQLSSDNWLLARVRALTLSSDLFLKLGHTGAAVHRRNLAFGFMLEIAERLSPAAQRELKTILPDDVHFRFLEYRHPDPTMLKDWALTNRTLQVRGSWKKLSVRRPSVPSRMAHVAFIWKSKLYTGLGMKNGGSAIYQDFWCLDLSAAPTARRWRELPKHPSAQRGLVGLLNLQMVVYKDKAYLYTGTSRVDYFDLVAETWGSLQTTFKRDARVGAEAWPPPTQDRTTDFCMEIVGGKLYVFGGSNRKAHIGTNILMSLDLEKVPLQWERLWGMTGPPIADYGGPGCRKFASSWINKEQTHIFVMGGMADRQAAEMFHQPHAADSGQDYDDCWSWSIADKKWRRERLLGMPPSARAEMGYTYNPVLDKVIVYGGYNPRITTFFPREGKSLTYSYYGDTFVLSSGAWRHVVTPGFPTYRAQARLLSDADTGRVYLFGGYSNGDYVPSRRGELMQTFGDLWTLRVDTRGGFFEEVDPAEERSARAGPWQRCFACGSAGFWKKCGGTCKGRVHFCDADCLKDGWKEHKQQHGCQKASS